MSFLQTLASAFKGGGSPRVPLARIADLARHTILHCPARRTAWDDWLAIAHHSRVVPAQSLEDAMVRNRTFTDRVKR